MISAHMDEGAAAPHRRGRRGECGDAAESIPPGARRRPAVAGRRRTRTRRGRGPSRSVGEQTDAGAGPAVPRTRRQRQDDAPHGGAGASREARRVEEFPVDALARRPTMAPRTSRARGTASGSPERPPPGCCRRRPGSGGADRDRAAPACRMDQRRARAAADRSGRSADAPPGGRSFVRSSTRPSPQGPGPAPSWCFPPGLPTRPGSFVGPPPTTNAHSGRSRWGGCAVTTSRPHSPNRRWPPAGRWTVTPSSCSPPSLTNIRSSFSRSGAPLGSPPPEAFPLRSPAISPATARRTRPRKRTLLRQPVRGGVQPRRGRSPPSTVFPDSRARWRTWRP